jgi:hypothetical protein
MKKDRETFGAFSSSRLPVSLSFQSPVLSAVLLPESFKAGAFFLFGGPLPQGRSLADDQPDCMELSVAILISIYHFLEVLSTEIKKDLPFQQGKALIPSLRPEVQ